MNYAFMSFSCPDLRLGEMLDLARDYGYGGTEPRIEAGHAHGIELHASQADRQQARRIADDRGIALCCIATSRRYADPASADQNVQDTLRCVDLAADVGAPRIRVFGGRIAEGLSRQSAIDLVAESLHAVADHALSRGVTVCIETHDDWCDPAHVAQVVERVHHPAIAVNWDVMHPVRVAGRSIDEAFQALQPWIRHVHVHDGIDVDGRSELRPVGEGVIDVRRAIQLLHAARYDGYLSGEWIGWEPYAVHLPRELDKMLEYEQELA